MEQDDAANGTQRVPGMKTGKTNLGWMEGMPERVRRWPEARLGLVHLLRAALGQALPEALIDQVGTLSVGELGPLIRRHRTGAFLHRRLPDGLRSRLNKEISDALAHAAERNQLKALRQTAALVRFTRKFTEARKRVRCLKGPLLAQNLYGGQGIRHAGDIDLVIEESEVREIDALLREEGFRRVHPPGDLSALQWNKYTEVWRDCEYHHPEQGVSVEVMWRLANHDALQDCVGGELNQEISGYRVNVLPEAVHGLYLLVHGAHHGWFRLFWLVDIALLMQDKAVDWAAIDRLAATTGLTRPYRQGLHLAHELLGVPYPEGFKMDQQDVVEGGLLEDAYWQLELSPEKIRFGLSHVRRAAYTRRLLPDRAMQRRERAKRWVNPADWRAVRLSDRWFWLYGLLWPFLWVGRQVRRVLRSARKR